MGVHQPWRNERRAQIEHLVRIGLGWQIARLADPQDLALTTSNAQGDSVAGIAAACGCATASLPLPVKRVIPSLIGPNDTGQREPGFEEGCTGGNEVEGRPLTDAELIDAARRGDVAAYEELVRRYEELAFRTAYLVCGDADEARDAAQEGFLRAFDALGR